MSSLQFLNKKSWHVGTRKNEEKVWLLEQAAKKEAERVAELQKQLDEERKLEAVRRLELESGNSTAVTRAPCVQWMYEGPGVAASQAARDSESPGAAAEMNAARKAAEQEDMLLGKKEATLEEGQQISTDFSIASTGDSVPPELVVRDAENKLREDPLLIMLKRPGARKARGLPADNPSKESSNLLLQYTSGDGSKKTVSRQHDKARSVAAAETSDHKREKLARKEYRAKVREERRLRREERERHDTQKKRKYSAESHHSSPSPRKRQRRTHRGQANGDTDRESGHASERASSLSKHCIRSDSAPCEDLESHARSEMSSVPEERFSRKETPPIGDLGGAAAVLSANIRRHGLKEKPQKALSADAVSAETRAAQLSRMKSDAESLRRRRENRMEAYRKSQKNEEDETMKRCEELSKNETPQFLLGFAREAIDHALESSIARRHSSR